MTWLPDLVLDESREHLKKYQEVDPETTDADRPSFKIPETPKPKAKRKASQPVADIPPGDVSGSSTLEVLDDASIFTAQHARMCVECKVSSHHRSVWEKEHSHPWNRPIVLL